MSSNFSSHTMKKLASNIQSSRTAIASKKNIPSNLSSLKQTFAELDSSLKGQAVYIKQLDQTSSPKLPPHTQKISQQKKNMIKMIDMVYQEIVQYFEVCKEGLCVGLKDKKDSGGWNKILTDIWKRLESLKGNITTNNIFQVIFNLLNLRDNILKQILRGIIYQKHLLWLDLKIPYQSYVHNQIQSILNIIKSSHQKYGFVPTKLQYTSMNSLNQGRWNFSNSNKSQGSIPSLLGITLKDFKQITQTIKNYSDLNQTTQTFQDINQNKVIVKGLRQKIEQHCLNYNILLQKYRSVQIKDNDWQLKSKLQQIQGTISKKDHEINLLNTTISSNQNTIQQLKDKIKQLQQQLLKLNISYYPKLKQVDGFQKGMMDQFYKIRKQVQSISVSLENDNELKNRLQNQIKDQKELVNSLVHILGRQRRKIQQIKQENKKLDQLVMELTNKHFPS